MQKFEQSLSLCVHSVLDLLAALPVYKSHNIFKLSQVFPASLAVSVAFAER